jgi:inosine-uridine nucleoside N-ribohydrolase
MASNKLQRVIIDTDPGVDDAQAIVFALRLGAFQIDAVTTVFGNCPVETSTRNARTLLELCMVDGVPIFMGAGAPLVRPPPEKFGRIVHGDNGFGDHPTPEPAYPLSPGDAAVEMARLVADNPGEITILALGPLTNVATAIRLEPTFVKRVKRIILMGGVVRGPGNVGPFSTANIRNDPEAAHIVFGSGADVTMVGQDVTRHVRIEPPLIQAIRDHDSSIATLIGEITRFYEKAYASSDLEPHLKGFPVHDLLVMVYAVAPELFETEQLLVKIETTGTETLGMTVADFRHKPAGDPNVTVCTKAKAREILDWYRLVIVSS